jgi:D-glycero-alpha-D-manno-heptose-7-phosphate kinase
LINLPKKSINVYDALKSAPVEASAPCRIDSGGTWDIKAMSLPFESIEPVTVNIALDLRTRVRLVPYKGEQIRISSRGFSFHETAPSLNKMSLMSPFGIFFAAVARFGFTGLGIDIESDSPIRSALGGSSTALTALIKALGHLGEKVGIKHLPPREILALGYQIEDGISGGFCGMQDQAAAVYGGVNLWQWRYGRAGSPYLREPLLNATGCLDLAKHILVANSGRYHDAGKINRSWVKAFLSGRTRSGWIEANRAVHELADSLKRRDWNGAGKALKKEMAIRRKITPDALIPETQHLIEVAENEGCGARFAGAGAGGAVWAIGDLPRLQALRDRWGSILNPVRRGEILKCAVDPKGVA